MNVYSMSGCITSHLNSDASGAGTNQVYTYDGYTSNSNINYVSAQIMYTNIKDCIFNASNAQRPPFISFYLSNNGVYKTINIEKNRFNGGALDSIALCFYYYNTGNCVISPVWWRTGLHPPKHQAY